jgi:uncharacterized protein (TIRG00374 family)
MKMGWRGALGLALSVGLLAWTLRDVHVSEVWDVLRRSNLALFVLSAVTATAIFPVRAWRWRYILEPVAPRLPFGMLWRAIAIGMMLNNTIPARAGEIARAYVLARESGRVRFPAALASLVIDRVFDAIILVVLLVLAMLAPAFPGATTVAGQPIERGVIVVAVFALGMLAALAIFAFFPDRALALYDAVVGRISSKLAARVRPLVESFAHGLGSLRSPRLFFLVFFWTVVHWLLNAFAFWLGFKAVGIDAPYSAALFLQSVIAIVVAAPSSPGFFGLFEFAGTEGLAIYGVPSTEAVSWALGFHILSFIPITVIGAWYFTRMGMHLRDIAPATEAAAVPDGAKTERA